MKVVSVILCAILVSCSTPKQPEQPVPPPKITYYYDTVIQVQYMGLFHDVPKLRLKNNNNTFKVIPSGSIINVGDIVETKKTIYPNGGGTFFESNIKGTNIDVF
jgi:hypothetical protein